MLVRDDLVFYQYSSLCSSHLSLLLTASNCHGNARSRLVSTTNNKNQQLLRLISWENENTLLRLQRVILLLYCYRWRRKYVGVCILLYSTSVVVVFATSDFIWIQCMMFDAVYTPHVITTYNLDKMILDFDLSHSLMLPFL